MPRKKAAGSGKVQTEKLLYNSNEQEKKKTKIRTRICFNLPTSLSEAAKIIQCDDQDGIMWRNAACFAFCALAQRRADGLG